MSFEVICTTTRNRFNSPKEILKCPYCDKVLVNVGFALLCQ
jgi:uncharacterized Zn-finger protein